MPCATAMGASNAPATKKPHEPAVKHTTTWVTQAATVQLTSDITAVMAAKNPRLFILFSLVSDMGRQMNA